MYSNRSVLKHLMQMQSEAADRNYGLVVVFDTGKHAFFSIEKDGQELLIRYGKRGQYSTWLPRYAPLDPKNMDYLFAYDTDHEPLEIITKNLTPIMKVPATQVTATEGEYVGHQFGLLTVTAMLGYKGRNRMARCVCSCGGMKDATVSQLRKGAVISCGCQWGTKHNAKPLTTGDRYGHLTVVEKADRPAHDQRTGQFYRVRCDCGKEVVRRRDQIVVFKNPTCGCGMKISYAGKRFGKLAVLAETRRVSRNKELRVRCDCGTEKWVRLAALVCGKM